jgi:outer membrane protein OmpA-like peptidoglycan-associated protein
MRTEQSLAKFSKNGIHVVAVATALVLVTTRSAAGQERRGVPLAPGLILTWASSLRGEPDYETRMEVTDANGTAVTLRSSWNRGSRATGQQWHHADRSLSHDVRRTTHAFYASEREKPHMDYATWTLEMASGAILGELKTRGQSTVRMSLPELSRLPYEGTLTRVGYETFPVVFNGQRVMLRGLRARGRLDMPRAPIPWIQLNFLFLDDSVAPWILAVQLHQPDGFAGARQLVRVSYRPDVEAELVRSCRASVYDIYFATASADLDPGSAPTLAAIAKAMGDHPDWRLTIVGHTDSIGTASANLDLSRRRAEAAQDALVTGFTVPAGRLRAEGRGESQPVEDNGTPAGRARNRRVDLLRGCS